MPQATHLYAVAIGSNRRHISHGRPAGVVEAAIAALDAEFELFDASPIILNKAAGGAGRDFANAVALVRSALPPEAMLAKLKGMEREFGRRPGRRWGARVLDLDIVLWSGGAWASPRLIVPHRHMRQRDFVLGPAAAIAPEWRDPLTALTVRQLRARLTRANPLP